MSGWVATTGHRLLNLSLSNTLAGRIQPDGFSSLRGGSCTSCLLLKGCSSGKMTSRNHASWSSWESKEPPIQSLAALRKLIQAVYCHLCSGDHR